MHQFRSRLAKVEGEIVIDGRETSALGLHELRSQISIIPQEPVLFSGTMRHNLDPFDEYPDHVLWRALEEVSFHSLELANHVNNYDVFVLRNAFKKTVTIIL